MISVNYLHPLVTGISMILNSDFLRPRVHHKVGHKGILSQISNMDFQVWAIWVDRAVSK